MAGDRGGLLGRQLPPRLLITLAWVLDSLGSSLTVPIPPDLSAACRAETPFDPQSGLNGHRQVMRVSGDRRSATRWPVVAVWEAAVGGSGRQAAGAGAGLLTELCQW